MCVSALVAPGLDDCAQSGAFTHGTAYPRGVCGEGTSRTVGKQGCFPRSPQGWVHGDPGSPLPAEPALATTLIVAVRSFREVPSPQSPRLRLR